ncbi:MAG: TIR domain-containing protein, partial [Anaerolineae bacterium]
MSDTEANYDLFVSYAEADRAWVEGYLLDALTTAGVRCHSEAAFTLGAPRILEFERAIQQSRRTLLVLSPAYLAEHFDQFADVLAQSYGLETASWPVIPLILQPSELPPRLAMLTALDAADPADWPAVIERLCEALQRPVPGPAPKPACPYPGMVPFSETDSDRFYGRDEEVRELLERLRLHPFVTVIGPSGSGKSSLVFAGLVPALRQSGLFGPDEWLVRALRPGEAPLDALTDALDGDPTDPARAVTELLATGPDVRRLLLVVDQFEELFTLARLDVEPFQQALMQLAETPDCYVALTVRADFYPDLMAAPLWREIKTYRAEVLPLDEDGLRQAIVRPAEDVGVFVETALVERLVTDAAKEPGILPLIQETLVLLWERLERRFLPLSAYEALGGTGRTGLQMAMARRADAALAGLTPEQQAMARRIFLRLVQFGEGRADTCRQQPIAALRSAGDDADRFDRTLEHLTHNRLLTLSGEEGGDDRKVDIAHEALIAGWPTLRGWLAERREAEQTRRRLEAKAAEWVRLGRGSGGLLDEVVLLEAERWLASPEAEELGASEALTALATKSQEAIEAAEREREAARQWEFEQAQALAAEAEARRLAEEQRAQEAEAREREQAKAAGRLRRLAVGLALALVLALMATFFAVWQSRVATARQLTAQAQTTLVQERFHMATLLALEANRLDKKEGVDVLHQIPYHAPHRDALALEGHKDWVNSVAWHPDGRRLASGSSDRRIIIWDTETGEAVTTLKGHTGTVFSVAWHPDGRRLASGSSDGRIIIWDTETGETVTTLEGYTGPVNNLAWHPDGRTLAIGSYYRRVVIWNTETGETILIEHGASVNSVAWHPDGRRLAYGVGDSVGEDDRILIWDKETG